MRGQRPSQNQRKEKLVPRQQETEQAGGDHEVFDEADVSSRAADLIEAQDREIRTAGDAAGEQKQGDGCGGSQLNGG